MSIILVYFANYKQLSYKKKLRKLISIFYNFHISVPVRLGGNGSSLTEGFVEALNTTTGRWGGVCHNSFDVIDAHVVCRMMGFTTAIVALANGAADDLYGTLPSNSSFVLDNLACSGLETSIFDCRQTGELSEICDVSQIAGVKCATSKLL